MTADPISRRRFLAVAGTALGGAAAAGIAAGIVLTRDQDRERARIGPSDPAVELAERRRRPPGAPVREVLVTAAPVTLELAGRAVRTWAYDGRVPGPEIRVRAGEVLRVPLANRLPDPTSIHWHGIALRNDMDGVPGMTQQAIAPGTDFVYEYAVPDPGTYFYHPHVGTQLDRGLYAPLIVEDPSEPGAYDRELTIMLDDWIDGMGESPDDVLERLLQGGGQMEGMEQGGMGDMAGMGGETEGEAERREEGPLGQDTGDVRYPLYLVNGRPPADPVTFRARPGERIRLRIVNAGSDTPFRVALGGHRLTPTPTGSPWSRSRPTPSSSAWANATTRS